MAGIYDYSTSPDSNGNVLAGGTINIAEGCPAGNLNNAERQIMADLAAFIANAVLGALNVSGALTRAGNTVWDAGNLNPASYQTALGFTPVQQGGGTGQGANKIYIGWNGSKLKAQVDALDLGTIPFEGNSPTFSTITSTVGVNAPQVTLAPGVLLTVQSGKAVIIVGGTAVMSVDSSGNIRTLGNITANAGTL